MTPSTENEHAWNPDEPVAGVRLQKVMAAAGVASRRVCEDMIAAGRVTVNGEVVTEPGRRIDPDVDEVAVDDQAVQLDTSKRYLMLNKPVGIYSSLRDERGRPDLREFTEEFEERLFNVGRLDAETSGLLILTNDGDLAHVLAHPSFGVLKTYIAKVTGRVTPQTIQRLTQGVDLEDGPIQADRARILSGGGDQTLVEITLHSGRNRIVRRQFGPLHLGSLGVGRMRDLTSDELGQLLTISREARAQAGPANPQGPGAAAEAQGDVDREDGE